MYKNTTNLNNICIYSTILQPKVFFFIIKLLSKFHTYRSQIPDLNTSDFAFNYKNFKEST